MPSRAMSCGPAPRTDRGNGERNRLTVAKHRPPSFLLFQTKRRQSRRCRRGIPKPIPKHGTVSAVIRKPLAEGKRLCQRLVGTPPAEDSRRWRSSLSAPHDKRHRPHSEHRGSHEARYKPNMVVVGLPPTGHQNHHREHQIQPAKDDGTCHHASKDFVLITRRRITGAVPDPNMATPMFATAIHASLLTTTDPSRAVMIPRRDHESTAGGAQRSRQ